MDTTKRIEQGTATGLLPPGSWHVDPARSTVGFAIKHMLGTVRGRFREFSGEISSGPRGTRASGVVATASIDTGVRERDAHLRQPWFLDAARHPEIRFDSRRVERAVGDAFSVAGDLAIAGTTNRVRLRATVEPDGTPDRAMLRLRGAVDRSDFGIAPKGVLEAGLGRSVAIELDLVAVRTPERELNRLRTGLASRQRSDRGHSRPPRRPRRRSRSGA